MGHIFHRLNVCRRYCSTLPSSPIMKYLNVAEKNDAAKNISAILARGASNRREGFSKFNKIYEFSATVFGQQAQMVMTSVSGHLLNYEFTQSYRSWQGCSPAELFDAPVMKVCQDNYKNIKRTLEREIRSCQGLIIWTDCDREGENIGFEIIKVCSDIKPDLRIYRAKFSEITAESIFRALNTLIQPNRNVSDAVDVRQEIDLRTGAAFTRLQTLRFQRVFPQKFADKLVSYGSCQFPTLGFVVERYLAIQDFIPETFWKILMRHTVKELTTEFQWQRERLFEKSACEAILDICQENPTATVESVTSKPKSKWRPLPLDTVEMEKTVSKKLRISAKDTMKIAEKLYNQGFISYPRTETNIFPKELNLVPLVEQQQVDHHWGPFARRVMEEGGPNPRQGRKSDQAHPPIHPTKYAPNLDGNEKRVYEYIVRHFLACVHKDAQGFETVVTADIAGEKFVAKGLIILERNYLDVYTYEQWNAKEINNYSQGDTFQPSHLGISEGTTSPPKLLTEADLIALMDKHGIGTDATHAEHIETIKSREYVGLEGIYFVPGILGMGLVEGYNSIGLEVSVAKPHLRAEFERDLKLICEGRKDAETVRREQVAKYKHLFEVVTEKIRQIDEAVGNRISDRPLAIQDDQFRPNGGPPRQSPFKCPKCGRDMHVKDKKNGSGKYIGCDGFPECKNAVWLPQAVDTVEVLDENCPQCGPNVKKLKMKLKQNLFPGEPNPNTLCIGGCNENVMETLSLNVNSVRQTAPQQMQPQSRIINNPVANQTITRPNINGNIQLNNTRTAPVSGSNDNTTFRTPQDNTMNATNIAGPSNRPSDEDVLCKCGQKAIQLTVRKDTPNKGRLFYTCQSKNCDFFLWASDQNEAPSTSNTMNGNRTMQQGEVVCNCDRPAVKRTVAKEGPNKGRQFYCCSKITGTDCRFFKWADEVDDGGGGHDDDHPGGGGGGGNFAAPRKAPSSSKAKNNRTGPYNNQARAKRKCSVCAQEGHTKNKCPNVNH